MVEVQNFKIKKQNLKMYYTTFKEQFKFFFKCGFLQGYLFIILTQTYIWI